ncbi:substrate-binding periplasmic protein [Reinekea blandensis]|uniref:Uncharacterized protein n=1 Tax=Reinekea blandensis MED297 TaxID=314283 RepID=A4BA53_9GAMM|nr:transporter substrate-binding domain-containing protein [Reinekea blandensis]EAR10809.1 hypothetical protein MED297_09876 [Reinekea sp. MED297] [Reinekea blandensis MED297]
MPFAVIQFVFLFTLFASVVQADTLKLTSLRWPPYSDSELKNSGASVAVVRAALEVMGHDLEVTFFPWPRAVRTAMAEPSYQGYFPEYWYETEDFIFSNAIGHGPLGFLENRQRPVPWFSLEDLQAFRLGVVQDYVNTPELDALIAAGQINTETVVSDSINILMVAHRRVDLAVIDPNVFHFLMDHDRALTELKPTVQMNPRLLTTKQLFVALRNTPEGRRWTDIINQGLLKIDVERIMAEHGIR